MCTNVEANLSHISPTYAYMLRYAQQRLRLVFQFGLFFIAQQMK